VLALSLNSYLRTLELLFYCPRGSAKWSSSIFLQLWIIIICDLYFARLKPEKVNSKIKYRRSKHMLHRLGSTQMQQEIQKRVVKLSREQEEVLKEQTVVEQHLADDEIK
jgi:hypothetical protein